MKSYIAQHVQETQEILQLLNTDSIEQMARLLVEIKKEKGRLFILGVGGSAANASHAVNDFRKICGIEAYAPTDNVSELSARTNDDGWETVFEEWLLVSRLRRNDCILVFSVGGGDKENNVSVNIVNALSYGKSVGCKLMGVVGRLGGYTAEVSDACCVIPVVNNGNITPHTEALQAVVWHSLVSHPLLKVAETKWESVK
jgi:D-sedoheptulose 7-phosphate isomerase